MILVLPNRSRRPSDLALACVLLDLCAPPAQAAQPISVESAPVVTEIRGVDIWRARQALSWFSAHEKHPECYRVLFSTRGEYLRVDFQPVGDRVILTVEGAPSPPLTRQCGKNVGFLIDKRGRIVSNVYSR